MPLAPGTPLGSYEIVVLLGSGGMGEVYRARDTKLGRDVALKTLPHSVATDGERIARFRREAQVLAALNHPHIGSIYGLEESNGQHFLVLELIDGETLAARIRRGPLPVREALAIAREIAEALEAAHDKGIIHRDLKPANIALTANDRVKVLDFGLAKAVDATAVPGSLDPAMSPTITSPALLTGIVVILGTAAYMSPEQAKGRPADKRSDVWALGCVLYEMLTGRRAFEGEDVSDTLAAVLKSESAWNALPPSLPPAVRSLLQGCLEKNPRERIGDLSTVLFVLKQQSAESVPPPSAKVMRRTWLLVLLASTAAAAAGAGATAAIVLRPQPPVPGLPVTRFSIPVPDGQQLTLSRDLIAVSPDGTRIVFVSDGRLLLRSLSDLEPRPIPGAEPGIHPIFSPDGESLLYWTDPALKRIPVTGGVPVTICEITPAPLGIDWTDSGIVFVHPGIGIRRVSPNGGTPATLVEISPSSGQAATGVQLLPDGDSLLFTIARVDLGVQSTSNPWDRAQIVTQSIRTGQRKTLVEAGSSAQFLPSGHLVYMTEGTMMAVPFDAGKLEVTGAAVAVLDGIRRSAPAAGSATHFAVSNSGVFAYVPGPARAGQDDIFIYDRKGAETALNLPRGSYSFPRVSPNGKWIAFETRYGRQAGIALYELSGTSSVRRLTIGGGNNRLPVWSRDGKHIAFQSDRDNDLSIWWQPVDGGPAERLTRPEPGTVHMPESWSPVDDVFLFGVAKATGSSLSTFSMRDRTASPFGQVTSSGIPTNAAFSPDGRWVAYQVGESGAAEGTLYVQPFPATGATHEIGRGGRPMWSRDGKELFFVPAPSRFMAVTVRTQPSFGFTNPIAVPRRFALAPPPNPRPYDILPDGRIVTVDTTRVEGQIDRIQVVLNWFEELKARVPVTK